jgi:hypothetical protein
VRDLAVLLGDGRLRPGDPASVNRPVDDYLSGWARACGLRPACRAHTYDNLDPVEPWCWPRWNLPRATRNSLPRPGDVGRAAGERRHAHADAAAYHEERLKAGRDG